MGHDRSNFTAKTRIILGSRAGRSRPLTNRWKHSRAVDRYSARGQGSVRFTIRAVSARTSIAFQS